MHDLAPIIKDLTVVLGMASIVTLLFQYIRQPVVLGYLVAGIIVGPHLITKTMITDLHDVKVIAELGVIFLMFSLGLEFSFHKLASVGFSASITGFMEVGLMSLIGFVTGILLKWSFYDSLFLGAALSISSTTIIIKALEELHLKGKRFAELIFGVLIVEDLLAILLLVALSSVVTSKDPLLLALGLDAIKLFVIVGSWFIVGYFLVPMFFRHIVVYASQETLTIVSIAFCLLLVCVAAFFHYSPALGAFIMGSILAETPQIHRIEELIRPIRDIFAAVFFVSVGMLIDPKIIYANLGIVLLISVVTIAGKIFSSSIGAILTGQSLSTSLRVGFGMAQIGEFSFIIVGLGLTMGVTNDELYPIVVAVSAITTFATPYLIRISGRLAARLEKKLPKSIKSTLNNYSIWVYRVLADKKDSASYRRIVTRFIMNAIIVAVIFTLTEQFLPPYIRKFIHHLWVVQILSWLTAMILSSPFIWAMLFAAKWNIKYVQSDNKNAFYLLVGIIWVLVIAEVIFLTVAYFYTPITLAILFVVALLFFTLFYSRLGKFYYWVEKNFLANISRDEEVDQFKQLAPWDNALASLHIDSGSEAVGKTLQELQIRQKYNINIVAILRTDSLISAPRGEQVLAAGDELVVLGRDENIEEFKHVITNLEKLNAAPVENVLNNFVLRAVLLDQDNIHIGKSIRDSQIREAAEGLVVGLERRGMEILNPDPATVLEVGDLLLMVGKSENLKKFTSNTR